MAVKTYVPKEAEIERRWFLVDADGQTLGRLASQIAQILRGKHKPMFTPHLDVGDYVIVVNAGKVKVTGSKDEQKMYYRHSGYPGGIKETSFQTMLRKHPDRVIREAVRGMIPHSDLGRHQLSKLKVYAGPDHPHQVQKPTVLEVGGSRT